MTKKQAILILKDTLPVMTGYIFLGFGFGVLMEQQGYGVWWSLAMSAFVYAGSMQYVAVTLLTSGAGFLVTALTTLAVNARHLFYGISVVDKYKGAGSKKPYMIFALTDETYSLVARELPEGINKHAYCFWVSLIDQIYWVTGTLLGSLAGKIIPIKLDGIEFVLTALFVTIFVEQWLSTKKHFPAVLGVCTTAACLVLLGKEIFLIPSMVIMALILTITRKAGKKNG